MREQTWLLNATLCSGYGEQNISNNSLVHGITNDRADFAKAVGFKNYSEMCMTTKMAGNLDNVFHFLHILRQAGIFYTLMTYC